MKTDNNQEDTEKNRHLKSEIESMKQSAKEIAYQSKTSLSVYLLGTELLKEYSGELLDDGRILRTEQIQIFRKINEICIFLIAKMNEAAETFERIQEK
jgi:hypothetical protein